MSRAALSAASEVYLQNGDLHALIYTSTRASHTAMMHLLDSTTSHDSNSRFKSSQSTASNLSISVQRRFVNLVSDGFRQTQFELFLGLRRKYYFPSLVQDPLEEKGRVVKSRAAFGALLAAPRCAINLVQNGEMLTEESFFLGEESGLSKLVVVALLHTATKVMVTTKSRSVSFLNRFGRVHEARVRNRSRMKCESLVIKSIAAVVSRIGCC